MNVQKINVKSIKKNKKSWKLIDQYLDDYEANFVSNDIMSMVSKSNKCKTCQQKITNTLINERHVLMGSFFFLIHVSHLWSFDMVSFNAKYFFQS